MRTICGGDLSPGLPSRSGAKGLFWKRAKERISIPHGWMAKHVFVGVAEKIPGANRIHYFRVDRANSLRTYRSSLPALGLFLRLELARHTFMLDRSFLEPARKVLVISFRRLHARKAGELLEIDGVAQFLHKRDVSAMAGRRKPW